MIPCSQAGREFLKGRALSFGVPSGSATSAEPLSPVDILDAHDASGL
jgi:hypothetical protein